QLFLRSHLVPALNVIGYWNLFWQPEVTSQTVPNFQVFLVGNDVPVNRFYRICVVSDVLVIFIRHEINLPCSTSKVLLFQPPSIPNNYPFGRLGCRISMRQLFPAHFTKTIAN